MGSQRAALDELADLVDEDESPVAAALRALNAKAALGARRVLRAAPRTAAVRFLGARALALLKRGRPSRPRRASPAAFADVLAAPWSARDALRGVWAAALRQAAGGDLPYLLRVYLPRLEGLAYEGARPARVVSVRAVRAAAAGGARRPLAAHACSSLHACTAPCIMLAHRFSPVRSALGERP